MSTPSYLPVDSVLELARRVYGHNNQILVAMEELNELACVLAKFPRYGNEREALDALREKVLDEYVDVSVVLRHVKAIFSLTDEEIEYRTQTKVGRLKRWLDSSSHMKQTTVDRDLWEKRQMTFEEVL